MLIFALYIKLFFQIGEAPNIARSPSRAHGDWRVGEGGAALSMIVMKYNKNWLKTVIRYILWKNITE